MAPPFDMSWTPKLENKLSTQIDGQLPDFIAEDHPQFSNFLKSYYQFLESGELQLTVNISNILLEVQTPTKLLLEDGTLLVTESGDGSTGKFVEDETITGSKSYATAKVLVEDLGNATPKLFISSQQMFETGETVTGGTSGATGVVTKYRANPVQNIQQLLAYADIDNTIHDFIEEFRKSFMAGIPTNIANGINKRNLEKHIGELYRRKGTKEGIKLFVKLLLDEEATIFYPNQYMMKSSAADWDKPTIIRASSPDDIDADELIGQSITGESSLATALVENSTTYSLSGGTSYIEFEISSVIGTFENGEIASGISGKGDVKYNFIIDQLLSTTSISNDGTLYAVDDVIDLDNSVAIGSGDISASVGTVERGSVSGVIIDSGGSNYEIGELVVFADNDSEDGLVQNATGVVTSVNGVIIDESIEENIITQEVGTNTFVELFNFQVEVGTLIGEAPYAVLGIDTTYSNAVGYYYPIYLTDFEASQSTIIKSSAAVNGDTFASATVVLDGNAGGTIEIGMSVRGTSIGIGETVTVTEVTSQSLITLSSAQTLLDNETLAFETTPTAVRKYIFLEYPDTIFYSPTATSAAAQPTYSSSTYTLYGGNFNYQEDHIYGESGNAASYTDGINTEAVFGDRLQSEWAVNVTSLDTNRYADEGFTLESGAGDITKISVTDPGDGYGLLPTVTVRTRYGNGANVLATTTDIGRISSVNITNPGFSYTEIPTSESRANFIIKDISGTFVVGDILTSHTGTVRSYDSTTQLLEVSIEDTVAVEGESLNVTSNEGMRLEDSLVDQSYVDDNVILDADIVYGENLVDEDGDRILIDAIAATTDFILLEDDQPDGRGELIMEFPESNNTSYELRQVKFILESAQTPILTIGGGSFIVLDADLEYEDNLVINQTNNVATILLEDPDPDIGLIVLEDDTPDGGGVEGNDAILLDGTNSNSDNADEKLLLEFAIATNEVYYGKDAIILDATTFGGEDENDKLYLEEGIYGDSNAGEKIVFNATDANGTNDPSNLIVLDSDVADIFGDTGVNNKLLYENDVAFTNLVLDATNADSLHASEKVLFEDAGFDFSAGKTAITTATASAIIVHADIAKLSFNLGTSSEKFGRFSGIEHLISEELIRLQDSYYYQDFSYEVQTNSSGNIYLNELKKAVHPAGFAVFAKVLSVSFVSAKAKVAIKPSEEGTIIFRFNNTIRTFDDISRAADYYTYTWDAPRVRHP